MNKKELNIRYAHAITSTGYRMSMDNGNIPLYLRLHIFDIYENYTYEQVTELQGAERVTFLKRNFQEVINSPIEHDHICIYRGLYGDMYEKEFWCDYNIYKLMHSKSKEVALRVNAEGFSKVVGYVDKGKWWYNPFLIKASDSVLELALDRLVHIKDSSISYTREYEYIKSLLNSKINLHIS